jgi:hypothetical protein
MQAESGGLSLMNVAAWQRWNKEGREYSFPHLRLRTVAKLVNDLGPRAYADLGCAGGTLCTLTPGIKYIGIDFVVPQEQPGFEFYQCDFNTQPLPVALANVELVTCSGILEYIEDLPRWLAAVRDATRPGTRFVVTYVNLNHISRTVRLLRGQTFGVHPDWRNLYSPRDLKGVITAAGFETERTFPVGLSVSSPTGIHDMLNRDTKISRNFIGSYLFAHHFAWLLRR